MSTPPRLRIAPVLDLACIVAFILVGRGRHEIDEGMSWFLTVLWPLFVGWFALALLTRLYTRSSGVWLALTITWIAGIAVAQVLRASFTDRPWFGIFTIIAVGFIGLTTFGWRLAATLLTRRRNVTHAT